MSGELLTLMNIIEEAEAAPTSVQLAAANRIRKEFASLVARWDALRTGELAALNAALRSAGKPDITVSP